MADTHGYSSSSSLSSPETSLPSASGNIPKTGKPTVLLNNDAHVPWLAFGTGTSLSNSDASEYVRLAISNGIMHLDGAQVYRNESSLGQGIKLSDEPRSKLFVTTKLWDLRPGETVMGSLKGSLERLGLDYVDLFLIHDPSKFRADGRIKAVWKEMEGVHQAGLAKAIGVSNFNVNDLKTVLEDAQIIPAVNQVELHPYIWKTAQSYIKFGLDKGIRPASYGGLTPLRVPDGPLTRILERIRQRIQEAHEKPVTTGHVLIKWLLSKGSIVVSTTTKERRMKEYLEAETLPDLTAEEIDAIEVGGAKLEVRAYMRHCFDE